MVKEKLILTDVDGCLLHWNKCFTDYMISKGYSLVPNTHHTYSLAERFSVSHETIDAIVHEYNTSDVIRDLPPFRDAKEYVQKLANDGFKFVAISSVSDTQVAHCNRKHNLDCVFGEGTFVEVHCIRTGASKYSVLKKWKDSGLFWIEDHYGNAVDGFNLGLKSVLINAVYNESDTDSRIIRVSNDSPWRDIYSLILAEYKGA